MPKPAYSITMKQALTEDRLVALLRVDLLVVAVGALLFGLIFFPLADLVLLLFPIVGAGLMLMAGLDALRLSFHSGC